MGLIRLGLSGYDVRRELEIINSRLTRMEEMLKLLVRLNFGKTRPLTERQKQVLELLKQGLTHQQVSERLGISRSYVSQICKVLRKKGFEV